MNIKLINKYLLIKPIWVLKWGLEHRCRVFIWPDGSQYEGNLDNGKQHSKGLFINDKGIEQEGTGKIESSIDFSLRSS